MKVVKFGGSSVANAKQIEKVLNIVREDAARKIVVVSAPGKRKAEDIKVTDLLIRYYENYLAEQDVKADIEKIVMRYQEICRDLSLDESVIEEIRTRITCLSQINKENPYLKDTFLASGEDNTARLIASYFNSRGVLAQYISPKEAGIYVSDEPSNARVLEESYSKLAQLKNQEAILIIPGFFGVTQEEEICTFSRGGSDITGAILAKGISAELYENFTDVDGIFSVHPEIVRNPKNIEILTYKEMRELAYAGFNVIHDEALLPVFSAKIPVMIKNTNNPSYIGTKITTARETCEQDVIGISSDAGFSTLNINKYLMNREKGLGRRLLEILEGFDISFEHMPSGIDDISVVMRSRYLTEEKEEKIIQKIKETLEPECVYFSHGLSIVMVVGGGTRKIGVMDKISSALSNKGIHLELINQGCNEVSIMIGVATSKEKTAVQALYHEFFEI